MQVICWVLGEYGTLADIPVDSVIDKLVGILDTQNVTDSVRGYLITALGKLCSQAQCNLSPQAHQLLHEAANSRNLDLQQHALEVQALLRYPLTPLFSALLLHLLVSHNMTVLYLCCSDLNLACCRLPYGSCLEA